MTKTQKKFAEWPILLFMIMLTQTAELALHNLPLFSGYVHLIPIMIAYIALTRSWYTLMLLTVIFAYIGSATIGYSMGIYLAVQMWTAMVLKSFVYAFALEGRRPFTGMVVASSLFAKILTWFFLKSFHLSQPLSHMVLSLPLTLLMAGLLAWLLFPVFVAWDNYFEHEAEDARDLDPNILK